MRPIGKWVIVERKTVTPTYLLITPFPDQRESLVGTVKAVGEGVLHKGKLRRLDVKPGAEIVYSSRIDKFWVGDNIIDVIDEGSVIGFVK